MTGQEPEGMFLGVDHGGTRRAHPARGAQTPKVITSDDSSATVTVMGSRMRPGWWIVSLFVAGEWLDPLGPMKTKAEAVAVAEEWLDVYDTREMDGRS